MKYRIILCIGIAILSLDSFAEFRAGIAVENVTPNPLLPVSGGVGPSEPTTRQLGELTVRALVLEDDDTRVAIVSADFLGFPSVLGNRVREKVEGIPPENILIGATHTHSAPDCYGFADEQGKTGADLVYLDSVCTKMAKAINQALENLQPVSVKIATDKAAERIAYNYYAPQLYDRRCHVMQFIANDSKPFITLVNYAIHPEVLGPEQGILSPDLIGPLYDRIATQGGGTGIFMAGAQGGMITADCRGPDGKDIQTWDECIRIGNLLADEALRIVSQAPIQENPVLECGARTFTFPIDSPLLHAVIANSPLGYGIDESRQISTQVNLVNLGNAQILTIPGEALPNIGFYLKRNMNGDHQFLFGLTNDAFGYILTKEDFNSFERYNYISRTSLGEMTGEIFIDNALDFVNNFPKPVSLKQDQ